jgi:hypothetical protein
MTLDFGLYRGENGAFCGIGVSFRTLAFRSRVSPRAREVTTVIGFSRTKTENQISEMNDEPRNGCDGGYDAVTRMRKAE